MENLSKGIAKEISQSLQYDTEKEAVIAYGLLGILQLITNIGLTLLLGFIFGVPGQAILLSFSVSLLRRFSGGAHSSSLNLCTIVGLVYSIAFARLSVTLTHQFHQTWMPIGVGVVSFAIAWITIVQRAPVDHPNKPIRSIPKKQRMRRGSFAVMAFYTAMYLFLVIIGCDRLTFRSFGYSLVFGVLWQTFTMTPLGQLLLSNLDKNLIKRR